MAKSPQPQSVKILRAVFIVSLAALGIWQYRIVAGKETMVGAPRYKAELRFTMNSGRVVSLPDTSERYNLVMLWSLRSERSLELLAEVSELAQEGGLDTLVNFYLVNLSDSLDAIRATVDFDNILLPFAHSPSGEFMDRYQVRSLPLTILYDSKGNVLELIEGYTPGAVGGKLKQLLRVREMLGPGGTFQFP